MEDIFAILKSVRPDVDFTASDDFIGDGLLDSFDVVTLVAELDEKYSISIDGLDIIPENFRNVDTIKALLGTKGVTV